MKLLHTYRYLLHENCGEMCFSGISENINNEWCFSGFCYWIFLSILLWTFSSHPHCMFTVFSRFFFCFCELVILTNNKIENLIFQFTVITMCMLFFLQTISLFSRDANCQTRCIFLRNIAILIDNLIEQHAMT